MTKKQQALAIFVKMKDSTRKDVVEAFQTELGMTLAGASTYYANCKRDLNGGSFNVKTTSKKELEQEGKVDGRTLYSVCTPRETEEGTLVVDSTHSFYSVKVARNNVNTECNEVLVKGIPNLDEDWSKLQVI